MSRKRYSVQRETGSDWAVIDTARGNLIAASGLTLSEAEETAAAWNEEFTQNLKNNA